MAEPKQEPAPKRAKVGENSVKCAACGRTQKEHAWPTQWDGFCIDFTAHCVSILWCRTKPLHVHTKSGFIDMIYPISQEYAIVLSQGKGCVKQTEDIERHTHIYILVHQVWEAWVCTYHVL